MCLERWRDENRHNGNLQQNPGVLFNVKKHVLTSQPALGPGSSISQIEGQPARYQLPTPPWQFGSSNRISFSSSQPGNGTGMTLLTSTVQVPI